jgi:hypothetical protein
MVLLLWSCRVTHADRDWIIPTPSPPPPPDDIAPAPDPSPVVPEDVSPLPTPDTATDWQPGPYRAKWLVKIEEPMQWPAIAWNGREEILHAAGVSDYLSSCARCSALAPMRSKTAWEDDLALEG